MTCNEAKSELLEAKAMFCGAGIGLKGAVLKKIQAKLKLLMCCTEDTVTTTTTTTTSTTTTTTTSTSTTTTSTTTSTTTAEVAFRLGFVFDDIEAGSPVVDPSDVSQWNTFFDLPTNGTPFTSVLVGAVAGGTEVVLIGGSNVTGANSLFNSNSNLLRVSDTGVLVSLGVDFFNECTSATLFNLQGLVTAGDYCFNSCVSATTFNLPALTSAGISCFGSCVSATLFNIPLCATLGTTTGDDGVFSTITGNTITVNVPASLATANGGSPDGDLVYLAANNTETINYI